VEERHRVVRRGGAAPPSQRKTVRTFPLFFGILSSSRRCLWLLWRGVCAVEVWWARGLCSGGRFWFPTVTVGALERWALSVVRAFPI
jgi:hypothetical protein